MRLDSRPTRNSGVSPHLVTTEQPVGFSSFFFTANAQTSRGPGAGLRAAAGASGGKTRALPRLFGFPLRTNNKSLQTTTRVSVHKTKPVRHRATEMTQEQQGHKRQGSPLRCLGLLFSHSSIFSIRGIRAAVLSYVDERQDQTRHVDQPPAYVQSTYE